MNGADAPAAGAEPAEVQEAIDRKTQELRALEEQAQPVAKSIAPSAAEAIIDSQVRAVLGIVVRGLMVSAPTIPVYVLFNSIARQTGNLMAGALSGDVEAVAKVRKDFRLAFADGVQRVPILKATGPDPKRQG